MVQVRLRLIVLAAVMDTPNGGGVVIATRLSQLSQLRLLSSGDRKPSVPTMTVRFASFSISFTSWSLNVTSRSLGLLASCSHLVGRLRFSQPLLAPRRVGHLVLREVGLPCT